MGFTTIRTAGRTQVGRVDGDRIVLLDAIDVGELFARGLSNVAETGEEVALAGADLAPAVVNPRKVFCVGLNYKSHLLEINAASPLPAYPTLFAKWADTLSGPLDDIAIPDPQLAKTIDWEAELVVVVGKPAYRATTVTALDSIGGYTIANDISMRDWQLRTTEWLQGKAWDRSTPIGPVVMTPDEVDHARGLEISCYVNGEQKQHGNTADLLFAPADAVAYISTFTRLMPGDLILTGTTGGVGFAAGETELLVPGDRVITRVSGIGELNNLITKEL
jgi:acylpyruvate hydrolase